MIIEASMKSTIIILQLLFVEVALQLSLTEGFGTVHKKTIPYQQPSSLSINRRHHRYYYQKSSLPTTTTTSLSLFDFFRRNQDKDDDNNKDDKENDEKKSSSSSDVENDADSNGAAAEEGKEEKKSRAPFFARMFDKNKNDNDKSENDVVEATAATTTTTTTMQSTAAAAAAKKKKKEEESKSPLEKAKAMKAQAERIRLEAEKMDAQLTLEKIERLEKELSAEPSTTKLTKDEMIQKQTEMQSLQAKMRGEEPVPVPPPVVVPVQSEEPQSTTTTTETKAETTETEQVLTEPKPTATTVVEEEPLSSLTTEEAKEKDVDITTTTSFKNQLQNFKDAPDFMKRLMAKMVNVDFDEIRDINSTEVALRLSKMDPITSIEKQGKEGTTKNLVFASKKIQEMEERIRNDPPELYESMFVNGESVRDNTTALAIMLLEKFYNQEMMTTNNSISKDKAVATIIASSGVDNNDDNVKLVNEAIDQQWKSGLFGEGNVNVVGSDDDGVEERRTIEALFPKSCRKDGQGPKEVDVQALSKDILPKSSFLPSGKPEKVLGGYIIRGTNKLKNGDELINSIDETLSKSSLREKLSVFFVKDFTVYGDEDADITSAPVIYVTGPDVTPERRRLLLTLVSSLGVGTVWYQSVYPSMLNADIMKRADEQMALADAGMSYDLSFITSGAFPIFATVMGITVAHELGHRGVAALYGTNITLPTLVPSLLTGLTGSVTTFKSPPKNNQEMFDFAMAGPTVGIVASLAALYFGLALTVTADSSSYANYPALPLQLLRTSSLGGGIVESILGNGVLNIPPGAEGSQAISSINIPLHPYAIAGYTGLIINALALLPVGTTDGGRIAQTLFGRGLKLLFGQLVLLACFFVGFFGNDVFLFYTSFIVFFQNGNEIPSRNESDDIPFSRVLLATLMGFVTLLTLIPM